MSADPDFDALVEYLNAMTPEQRSAYVDRIHLETWGVTREQLFELGAKEIEAIAEARGLSVAGIAKDGEFSHEGDGKDHRN